MSRYPTQRRHQLVVAFEADIMEARKLGLLELVDAVQNAIEVLKRDDFDEAEYKARLLTIAKRPVLFEQSKILEHHLTNMTRGNRLQQWILSELLNNERPFQEVSVENLVEFIRKEEFEMRKRGFLVAADYHRELGYQIGRHGILGVQLMRRNRELMWQR